MIHIQLFLNVCSFHYIALVYTVDNIIFKYIFLVLHLFCLCVVLVCIQDTDCIVLVNGVAVSTIVHGA